MTSAESMTVSAPHLAQIVSALVLNPDAVGELETKNAYALFLKDIAAVVADHCGGRVAEVLMPANDSAASGEWHVAIAADEGLPDQTRNIWTLTGGLRAAATPVAPAQIELETYWTLSTDHLSAEERSRLSGLAEYELGSEDAISDLRAEAIAELDHPLPGDAFLPAVTRYGWMIRLPDIESRALSQPITPLPMWPGLSAVLEAARAAGIGRVRLDDDADVIPGLPVFPG